MNDNNLSDWMKKIHSASLPHQAPQATEKDNRQENIRSIAAMKRYDYVVLGLILLLGLVYRLIIIFFVTGPENAGVGWYGDTYHHWQIAYLTMTTGFHEGFLRLWDLKGMEYFWGLLHPLLLIFLFLITGSVNLVLARLLSTFFGLGCVFMLFLLSMRYFGRRVAYAIAFFGSTFSIAVFNDSSGMLEPIGIFLMLIGVYAWPRNPAMTGASYMLAAMVRAETWIFSIGLLIGKLFTKVTTQKKAIAIITWIVLTLIYMKYLLDHTGNAIYPIYWNFLANALGSWAGEDPLTPLQLTVRPILMSIGILSAVILGLIIYKKPKSLPLLLLGFGNIFFVTAFMGFGHYIRGWEWWFPVIRFFVFPYLFIFLMFFVVLNKVRVGHHIIWTAFYALIVLAITLTTQLAWLPIMNRFSETRIEWDRSVKWGREVGKFYTGGRVLFPDGDPHFTYTAVSYGGIKGENLLSQMFDPFYYLGEDGAFMNWETNKKAIIDDWLIKHNIRLAVFRNDTTRYIKLREKLPDSFEKLTVLEGGVYELWKVSIENQN